MNSDEWSVIVLKAKADNTKRSLVDFYWFVKDLIGVKDVHFLIRDRVHDEVVVSFRILLESNKKDDLENVIAFHLGKSMSEDTFTINPEPDHPLYKYGAWPWKETLNSRGIEKFTSFCGFLSKFSRLVVEMAENDYFHAEERVEIAHVIAWMLGFTEYGLLSAKGWEIGYYDRIEDKNQVYLRHTFNS